MSELERLSRNIGLLIEKNRELENKNKSLRDEISQLTRNLDFLEKRLNNMPDLLTKNKKLSRDREKIRSKVDGILKRLEEVNI